MSLMTIWLSTLFLSSVVCFHCLKPFPSEFIMTTLLGNTPRTYMCRAQVKKIVTIFIYAQTFMRNGKKMSHDWKIPRHTFLFKKTTTTKKHHDTSCRSRGHFFVSPLSDRFLIVVRLCRSWRNDWNWNSLHWTRVDPLQHEIPYICHRDIHFCKATTHQRLLLDPSSVQCSMLLLLKATTLIFTLTYNKCASAPWGGWSRLQLLRQNKAGFSLKRPALCCVAEPLHCICSGTHTVDQIQSSQH